MKKDRLARLPSRFSLPAIGAVALLSACLGGGGGGGESGSPPPSTSSTYSGGSVSGFGSVIVNGVRYDDSSAAVYDDDGNLVARAKLALGMTVDVIGSKPVVGVDGARSKASEIRYSAEMLGAVEAVDIAAQTLQVFGTTIKLKATTIIAGAAGLNAIAKGSVVEVHGRRDNLGDVVATRIELKAATVADYAADPDRDFRLRSRVVAVSGSSFTVEAGTGSLSIVSPQALPTGMVAGVVVKLRLDPVAKDGTYTAERIEVKVRKVPDGVKDVEIEGFISSFTSTGSFKVDGLPVLTNANTEFEDGAVSDLALGARVEVEGTITDGVLVARKIEFQVLDDNDDDNDHRASPDKHTFEFHGRISELDAMAQTFVLRGQVFSYTSETRFEDISGAERLSNGMEVEVRAVLANGGLRAVLIEAEDDEEDEDEGQAYRR